MTTSAATCSSRAIPTTTATSTASSASFAASAGSTRWDTEEFAGSHGHRRLPGGDQHRRRFQRAAGPHQDVVSHRHLFRRRPRSRSSSRTSTTGRGRERRHRRSEHRRNWKRCSSTTPSCPPQSCFPDSTAACLQPDSAKKPGKPAVRCAVRSCARKFTPWMAPTRRIAPTASRKRNYTIETLPATGTEQVCGLSRPRARNHRLPLRTKAFQGRRQYAGRPEQRAGARSAADPRVTHAFTLAVDSYGNVLQSAAVGYGRRYLDPSLSVEDQAKQSTTLCTYSESSFTNAVLESDDVYRTPLPAEASAYELLQVQPAGCPTGRNQPLSL